MGDAKSTYTVDDALLSMGFGKFQAFVLAYSGMAKISEAMEMMLLSFVGPSVQTEWELSPHEESLISSVVFIGMLVGAYSWGIVSDKVGFNFTALITGVAGFLSSFAPNYLSLIFLRFMVGVGLGGGHVLASWFLEFVPAPNRGTWMVVFSAFWSVGTILEASLAWSVMPIFSWRWLLAFSSLPSFALLLFYPITLESPRYLCMKGKIADAMHVLEKMARINHVSLPSGNLISHRKITDLDDITDSSDAVKLIANRKSGGVDRSKDAEIGGFNAILTLLSPNLIRSTLLLWMVFFGQAFSYYAVVLLTSELSNGNRKCGSEEMPLSHKNDVGLYRNIGRKRSMSYVLFTSCFFLLPLVIQQREVLTTLLLFGARSCISASFTILHIYAPEIYPTSVRATGVGVASSLSRFGGILCPIVAVGLVHNCHQTAAVLVIETAMLLSGVAVAFFPVETSGRRLSDHISV
ncbi:Organic cation/carnitine transporter 7 [Ananas comosus]|uniref:Organic cation/carnitine transporter 7 n=1 Tax=Ananas comosus TaxID=4615 RepID=A0A199V2F9_ANACO|nr:Organic cation/carnitine transporter 7 [Ananas comosus]